MVVNKINVKIKKKYIGLFSLVSYEYIKTIIRFSKGTLYRQNSRGYTSRVANLRFANHM
jgi:hypothetical protein